jgi:hypothetical protein
MNDAVNFKFTREVFTNTVRFRLLSNGIIHYTYLPNVEVDIKEHQINHDTLIQLADKNQKALLLIDADEFINVTSEARKFIRTLEPHVPIKARALVITSLGQRILASFYIRVQKPIVETKIFNNYVDAFSWLNTLK